MEHRMCKFLLLINLVAVVGKQVHAQESSISYDFVELSMAKGKTIDEDFTGYGAEGSFSIGESYFMQASYAMGETDDKLGARFEPDEIEIRGFFVGLGYHRPLSPTSDFVTSLKYVKSEVDFFGTNEDVYGYGIEMGLRSAISLNVELEGMIGYVERSDLEIKTTFEVSARYSVTPELALSAGYADGDTTKGITAGIRFNF